MEMRMEEMQMMMAQMHAQTYSYDMQLAQYFQKISEVYAAMAQGERKMYQHFLEKNGMQSRMNKPKMQPMMPEMMP